VGGACIDNEEDQFGVSRLLHLQQKTQELVRRAAKVATAFSLPPSGVLTLGERPVALLMPTLISSWMLFATSSLVIG